MASPLPSDRTEYDGKLLSARHKKKQAVNDKQLLLNRIALLKKEEQRAWKKIEKTRVRAEEIVRMRVENESQRLAREKAHRKAADAKRREAEENLALEERARAARAKLLDDLHEKKKQDVQKVHQERRLHRAEVSRQRQHEVAAKQDKVQVIKGHERSLRKQKQRALAERLEENREGYEAKVHAEEAARRRREKEVTRMEKQEMELIERLRNTQLVQQAAFHELEAALNGAIEPEVPGAEKKRVAKEAGAKGKAAASSASAGGEEALPSPAKSAKSDDYGEDEGFEDEA